ncbi:Inositol-trisphosphate 3-kinase B [Channa argus]|uniref:Seipin n=1 Tax=Channa argus TaxID=215402 RepID=A0A6G1PVI6_CHAAH|nr:Inositol-trisphosphate 3-kinase B [Channa argus]
MDRESHLRSKSDGDASVLNEQLLLKLQDAITMAMARIRQRVMQSFVVFSVVSLVLWLAAFLYGSFYYSYMPRATFSTPVHYHYRTDCDSHGSLFCTYPLANISLMRNKKHVLTFGQAYRISLQLEMPESPANQELGMFMIKTTCFSQDGGKVSSSVRSARQLLSASSSRFSMLRYRSDLLRSLGTLLFLPAFLTGAAEQKQVIEVELFSDYTDDPYSPSIVVVIEILSNKVQLYSSHLYVHAHFTGISYMRLLLRVESRPDQVRTMLSEREKSTYNHQEDEKDIAAVSINAETRQRQLHDCSECVHSQLVSILFVLIKNCGKNCYESTCWSHGVDSASTLNTGHKMDTTDDKCMEKMKVEIQNKQTVDNDFSARLSDEAHRHLTISEGSSSGCSKVSSRSRPKLQTTRSFPPYSQCIGGLGENRFMDSEHNSESTTFKQQLRHDETMRGERCTAVQEKKEVELTPRCARDEVKAKWRMRRKERLGGSYEVDPDGWERGQWSGKRRVEQTEREASMREDKGRDGAQFSEWKHSSKNLSFETKRKEEEDEERKSSSTSAVEGECDKGRNEEAEELSGVREGSTPHQWSSPHPILSKLLHSSSSTSSCSSINLSSPESDEVFSEGEEVSKKRKTLRKYHGLITRGEHCYIRLEDLLSGLRRPVIMDCKMGVRTYQVEELTKAQSKATLRSDMYQKMVKIDPSAPSEEEHAKKGVTKWRYLQWRDTTSSTSTLGFRIEGIMMEDGSIQRDFRKILTIAQVTDALLYFTRSQLDILVIGSSLLFVHDHSNKANVWMIDFGKTTPVPDAKELRHNVPWAEGSREDGYLIGLTSLIASLSQAISVASWQQENSCEDEKSVT